jgi:hypothetical protein
MLRENNPPSSCTEQATFRPFKRFKTLKPMCENKSKKANLDAFVQPLLVDNAKTSGNRLQNFDRSRLFF